MCNISKTKFYPHFRSFNSMMFIEFLEFDLFFRNVSMTMNLILTYSVFV